MNETKKASSNSLPNIAIKENDYLDVESIIKLETIVDKLKDSTLATQFIEKSYSYDEDGNIIAGSEVVTFNKADMVMCLGLGASFGMNPFVALSYGKNLNIKSIKKIVKGEKLGLDFTTALEQIYIWGDGSKEIVYTSIHIVNTVLTKIGVKRDIIKDGTIPYQMCTVLDSGKVVEFDPNVHKAIPYGTAPDVAAQVAEGIKALKGADGKLLNLIPVIKFRTPIYIAEVKLSRWNNVLKEVETISLPYSSQDAIDAGLLQGIDSYGNEVKGKGNWNAHIATHLRKMSIMNGARIIASDALQGVYLGEEISFIKDKANFEYTEAEEV
jgi:hypothetical protein